MIDPRTPVLIGQAQHVWRDTEAPEPALMWERVGRDAARDAAGSDRRSAAQRIIDAIETVTVVYCQTWQYDDPPARVADELELRYGIGGTYSGIGGTQPQTIVAGLSERVMAGDLDLALIVGGEALHTKKQYKRRDERPPWSARIRRPYPLEVIPPPTEIAHQVLQAYTTFALFDSARRARLERSLEDHRLDLGRELSRLSAIAARNPHAWFPVERSPQEITTPTADNRMVAHPYTKYMVSVMDVDAAGALLLASHAKADELGVPMEQRVYPRGWAYAQDPWVVAAHPDLSRSPAMAAAGGAALQMAGTSIDEVAHLDLYSCFASSLGFARDALGVADDRDVTVTGGLPYFGGAGSAYMVQSIATLMQVLRSDPGSVGLASGVGMHMTKHAFGAYSTEPPDAPPSPRDADAIQRALDSDHPEVVVADDHDGTATVAAYTVQHGRDGGAEVGIAVLDLPDGRRCYGHLTDPATLATIEREELVGQKVHVAPGERGVNLVTV